MDKEKNKQIKRHESIIIHLQRKISKQGKETEKEMKIQRSYWKHQCYKLSIWF